MSRLTTGYAEFDDGKLYYEISGEGAPLVLVHAGFVDSRMWDSQVDALGQHYRVIRFDMRGFGRSDPATGPLSRRHELYGLLRQIGVERATMVGCSMGGEMIVDLALEHPELVAALVVVSAVPSGFEMQGAPPPELFEMMAAVEEGDEARASEFQLRLWIDGSHRRPEQVAPDVRQRAGEMNRIAVRNNTWAIADTQPLSPLDPPAAGRLHEVQAPALIMAGALDHPEILRAADVMVAEIPNAQQVIIQDSAHLPNMEQPVEFNEAVLRFLDTLS